MSITYTWAEAKSDHHKSKSNFQIYFRLRVSQLNSVAHAFCYFIIFHLNVLQCTLDYSIIMRSFCMSFIIDETLPAPYNPLRHISLYIIVTNFPTKREDLTMLGNWRLNKQTTNHFTSNSIMSQILLLYYVMFPLNRIHDDKIYFIFNPIWRGWSHTPYLKRGGQICPTP